MPQSSSGPSKHFLNYYSSASRSKVARVSESHVRSPKLLNGIDNRMTLTFDTSVNAKNIQLHRHFTKVNTVV